MKKSPSAPTEKPSLKSDSTRKPSLQSDYNVWLLASDTEKKPTLKSDLRNIPHLTGDSVKKPTLESDLKKWPELSATERAERVRRVFAALASSNPLYAARAAKDPTFWETYSVGGPFMFPEEWLHMDPEEVVRKHGASAIYLKS